MSQYVYSLYVQCSSEKKLCTVTSYCRYPDADKSLYVHVHVQFIKKVHPKVLNHGEGPYLVESGYYRFHI